MRRLLIAAGFCVLAACQTTGGATQVSSSNLTTPATLTGSFGTDLNAFRASQGLAALQQSAALTQAAQLHAEDMTRRGYFSHKSPGGPNGNDLSARLVSGGCRTRAGAENIAQGQTSEASALVSWQGSAGHRRNMLSARYTTYGLGRSGNTWVLVLSNGC